MAAKLNSDVTIRCQNADGEWVWREVPGRYLPGGIFAVTEYGKEIGLTHVKSGFLVQNSIRTVSHGRRAAKKLLALPVSWDFTAPETVKQFPAEALHAINEIRKEATSWL